jgi:hypothetical protein
VPRRTGRNRNGTGVHVRRRLRPPALRRQRLEDLRAVRRRRALHGGWPAPLQHDAAPVRLLRCRDGLRGRHEMLRFAVRDHLRDGWLAAFVSHGHRLRGRALSRLWLGRPGVLRLHAVVPRPGLDLRRLHRRLRLLGRDPEVRPCVAHLRPVRDLGGLPRNRAILRPHDGHLRLRLSPGGGLLSVRVTAVRGQPAGGPVEVL